MADLKSTLTETLEAALWDAFESEDQDQMYASREMDALDTSGGFVFMDRIAAHLADVLLGLSGVAVTALPEPDHVEPGDEFENGRTEFALGDVTIFEDGEIHLFGAVWQLSDVKTLGAALLAAAVVSEGEQ